MNLNWILDKNKGMDCLEELFIEMLSSRDNLAVFENEIEMNFGFRSHILSKLNSPCPL